MLLVDLFQRASQRLTAHALYVQRCVYVCAHETCLKKLQLEAMSERKRKLDIDGSGSESRKVRYVSSPNRRCVSQLPGPGANHVLVVGIY